jgi:hypothetical protein
MGGPERPSHGGVTIHLINKRISAEANCHLRIEISEKWMRTTSVFAIPRYTWTFIINT